MIKPIVITISYTHNLTVEDSRFGIFEVIITS